MVESSGLTVSSSSPSVSSFPVGRGLDFIGGLRQEFHDNRILMHASLPRYLLRHIQEPGVIVAELAEQAKAGKG